MSDETPRGAFTLIELLIVISIMILLTTLALSGVAKALRSAALNQAASDLRAIASAAQERAIRLLPADGQGYPGVLIFQTDGRWAIAQVEVTAGGAASVDKTDALTDTEGRPVIKTMSPNVVVWLADDPADLMATVAWFYEPGTGRLLIAQGGGFSAPGAMIGYEPPALLNGTESLVFGAASGTTLPVAAPPSATNPGLSIRSRDQRIKISISVQPTGFIQTQEFN